MAKVKNTYTGMTLDIPDDQLSQMSPQWQKVNNQGLSVAEANDPKYWQNGKYTGTITSDNTITSDVLSAQSDLSKDIQQPIDDTNYQGIISGGLAEINSFNESFQKQQTNQSGGTGLENILNKYLSTSSTPPSATAIYNEEYKRSGMEDAAQKVNEAQKQLDLLNVQAAGLKAEAKAVPIQLQEESVGRGVTAAGIAPIEKSRLRQIALKSLPLEAQILAQQAIVTGNQNALKLAQDRLNKAFELRVQDAENQYNYKKDLRDKVYEFASKKEQSKIDALQQEEENAFTLLQDNIQYARDLAEQALAGGQSDIAAKLVALDPKSKNFMQEVAALQGKIVVPEEIDTTITEVGGRKVLMNNQTGEIIKDLGAVKVSGGGSSGKIKSPIVDKNTGEIINPDDDNYLLKVIQNSKGGKPVDVETAKSLTKAFNVVGQIGDLQSSISDENTDPILGILRSNNPYDVKAQQIKAQLTAIVPNLARGIYGEVGVLTDNDVALYSRTLPNLQSTTEARNLILAMTLKTVQRSIENQFEVMAGLGRDVSGLETKYKRVKEASDKFLSDIEPKKTAATAPVKDKVSSFVSSIQNEEVKQSLGTRITNKINSWLSNLSNLF